MSSSSNSSPAWIDIGDHPSNLDPTALLVSSPRELRSIYRTKAGYVATDGRGRAIEGYFASEREARDALYLESIGVAA